MGNFNQRDYYLNVEKPRRIARRAEKAAKLGIPRIKAGRPPTKPQDGAMELHLHFTDEVAAFIEQQAAQARSYQAWFDSLLAQEMERKTSFQ